MSPTEQIHRALARSLARGEDNALREAIEAAAGCTLPRDWAGLAQWLNSHPVSFSAQAVGVNEDGGLLTTYYLDGEPILRVHPLEISTEGSTIRATRKVERLGRAANSQHGNKTTPTTPAPMP